MKPVGRAGAGGESKRNICWGVEGDQLADTGLLDVVVTLHDPLDASSDASQPRPTRIAAELIRGYQVPDPSRRSIAGPIATKTRVWVWV
ncbi:MAG: hypothetical protein M1815_001979 [Lichina confinis]|nr:MAG: hypothetical protein M1815_001979 [Lichina confinis]